VISDSRSLVESHRLEVSFGVPLGEGAPESDQRLSQSLTDWRLVLGFLGEGAQRVISGSRRVSQTGGWFWGSLGEGGGWFRG
jgi:hypothetical protein